MNSIEINLGGVLRRLKFNQGALEIYVKSLHSEMVASSIVYSTIYAGLLGECYVKQIDPTFTFEDVTDWVDMADKDDINRACGVFMETLHYKTWLEEFKASVEDKKKVIQQIKETLNGQGSTGSPSVD